MNPLVITHQDDILHSRLKGIKTEDKLLGFTSGNEWSKLI
jgi:hypothetical protein